MGILEKLKHVDLTTNSICERLHYNGEYHHHTILGGICSLIAIFFFIIYALSMAIQIIHYDNRSVSSVANAFQFKKPNGDLWDMKLGDGYRVMIQITDYYHFFTIDETKIHVYAEMQ